MVTSQKAASASRTETEALLFPYVKHQDTKG